MKLEPAPKLDMRNTAATKKIHGDIMMAVSDVSVFFPIQGYLQSSGSRIPDAWSVKLNFSLTITFYITKTEARTKKSLT